MTLIEVVAAIAILGGVLVGLVLAQSRHGRQIVESRLRLEAVAATDDLVAGWWTSTQGVPVDASGELALPSGRELSWATRVERNDELAGVGSRVVRVEVREAIDPAAAETAPPIQTDDATEPLITVDLVMPDPEWDRARLELLQGELERAASLDAGDPANNAAVGIDGVNTRGATRTQGGVTGGPPADNGARQGVDR